MSEEELIKFVKDQIKMWAQEESIDAYYMFNQTAEDRYEEIYPSFIQNLSQQLREY
tara:strand:+ start:208 stop:375 length:168 start_codon:yes stop_codon:yes gene_type:complete